MAAYDAQNDVIHMLWIGVNAPDGVFYRRYTPVRDGDNKITAIKRTEDVNLVLDYQTDGAMQYQHPLLLHMDDPAYGKYGALLAVWSARNGNEGGGNEIRASMALLGDDPNGGGAAANWRAPTGAGDSAIGNAPQVPSSVLLANNEAGIPYASATRASDGATANDVYLFYHDGGVVGNWAFKRMRWNADANDWSAGLTDATVITKRERAGADKGYTLKQQLGSKPVEDAANGRVYFGFATWKSDEDGDTWSFVAIDTANNDALSDIVDVYSAGGAHSYAPTGDLTFDEPSGRLVASYITTGEQHPYVQMYDHLSPLGDPIIAMDDAPADIPLLPLQTRYGDPSRLLMVFRDTIDTPNAPYKGWVGWLMWE
ncbi:MAG: hypothetical protein HC828_10615 [Blastochloris sp.]|nr:hypothetical protein [Blastochloris sp.]